MLLKKYFINSTLLHFYFFSIAESYICDDVDFE